jgi:hypothetical protein
VKSGPGSSKESSGGALMETTAKPLIKEFFGQIIELGHLRSRLLRRNAGK